MILFAEKNSASCFKVSCNEAANRVRLLEAPNEVLGWNY
jgi:hypothetical protein